jgi:peptidyl-prolyl cis-trans isomerase C
VGSDFLLKKEMPVMKQMKGKTFRIAMILITILLAVSAVSCKEKTVEQAAETIDQSVAVEKQPVVETAVSETEAFVAIVNGVSIPTEELDRKMDMVKQRYAGMGVEMTPDQMADMRNRITDSLIEQEVLVQESAAQNISVDQADIDGELQKFKQQFPNEEAFSTQMTQMGYTEDSLKKEIRRSKAIQQLIEQKIVAEITVPEEEMAAYYEANPEKFETPERVRARHILVRLNPEMEDAEKEAARKKIETVKEKLSSGEDFEKLVSENSDCPSSKNGGDLDYFARGQMVKPFEDAAFAMNPGEISDIVETQFGYHIIKVEDKQTAATLSFEEAREGLAEQLKGEKARTAVKDYIEKLKEKASIQHPGHQ